MELGNGFVQENSPKMEDDPDVWIDFMESLLDEIEPKGMRESNESDSGIRTKQGTYQVPGLSITQK